jgi:hypothetical protein
MTQDQNYYVIVGRDGTRAVAQCSPAQIDGAAAPNGDFFDRRAEPGPFTAVELGRRELIDETAS